MTKWLFNQIHISLNNEIDKRLPDCLNSFLIAHQTMVQMTVWARVYAPLAQTVGQSNFLMRNL